MEIFFKQEYHQVTGSFKERGARFALIRLSESEKKIGVIAASAGKTYSSINFFSNLQINFFKKTRILKLTKFTTFN